MTLEIREAKKNDYTSLSKIMGVGSVQHDADSLNRFENILSQSGHSVLLGFIDGELAGALSVSIIDGIGEDYPFAVLSGAGIKSGFEKIGLERSMLAKAEYIAAAHGCRRICTAACADT